MTSQGPMLGSRYLLVDRIATGGMGEVWRARDELLGREVAVKLLRQHVAGDPAFRQRFRTEARITAGLADPGIAQVYDYGEHADGAYLVMELVSGEPLSAILVRNPRLTAEVTLDVIHQAARGLAAAHAAGVIHRDVKPGNLLVTASGVIKITDFGIARAMEAAPVTQTGTVLGTAQYVSPEQASGAPLTPSTDLYSLGVVAYECLAGRLPFDADTHVGLALQHLNEEPPPLPGDVPPPVAALVRAMLAKSPQGRPASAEALGDRAYALREALATPGGADLRNLTDPAGWRVRRNAGLPSGPQTPVRRERYDTPTRTTPATDTNPTVPPPVPGLHAGGEPGLYDPAEIPGVPTPETGLDGVRPSGRTDDGTDGWTGVHQGGSARGRRRGRTVLMATAGAAAVVGLGTFGLAQLPPQPVQTGGTAIEEPTFRVSSRSPRPKPAVKPQPVVRTRTATPRIKTSRPTRTPSASVSSSVAPTRKPTPKPSPTPTPTPTPEPTETPTGSMTPTDTPEPGDTNPSNGET